MLSASCDTILYTYSYNIYKLRLHHLEFHVVYSTNMVNMKVDAEQLLKEARALAEQKRRRASKLTPYRDFIINAVKEGIPLTTVRAILETQCQLEVSYNNLRGWIHRQPEFRKSAEADDTARSGVMLSE
jgi:hypothetical protein